MPSERHPHIAEGIERIDDPLGKVCDQVTYACPLLFLLRRSHSNAYLTSYLPEHYPKNLPCPARSPLSRDAWPGFAGVPTSRALGFCLLSGSGTTLPPHEGVPSYSTGTLSMSKG